MMTTRRIALGILFPAFLLLTVFAHAQTPSYQSELIFPPMPLHNHGSCIVECPNGDLLVSWYRGSGERTSDDVAIFGARRKKGKTEWSKAFSMADTPGFPDCNSTLIIDPQKRLWLFWPLIIANTWESALLKVKVSSDYQKRDGEPRWEVDTVVHLKPGSNLLETVKRDLDRQWEPYIRAASPADQERFRVLHDRLMKQAEDKQSVRIGWMPRPHPFILDDKRLIVPLYSDGFDFSLMAITDDWGKTWQTSAPLVGPGNVQPSLVKRKDGTLVAFFRDNGPPPKRVMVSELSDAGMTWTLARDTELPDPGAGVEAIALKSGRWLLINNNTERGRHRLALSISEDEGRTWPRIAYLEKEEPGAGAGSYHYRSIIQAKDGTIHVSYSITLSATDAAKLGKGQSIKHAQFNEAWLRSKAVPR